jgi:hypothetical protein
MGAWCLFYHLFIIRCILCTSVHNAYLNISLLDLHCVSNVKRILLFQLFKLSLGLYVKAKWNDHNTTMKMMYACSI